MNIQIIIDKLKGTEQTDKQPPNAELGNVKKQLTDLKKHCELQVDLHNASGLGHDSLNRHFLLDEVIATLLDAEVIQFIFKYPSHDLCRYNREGHAGKETSKFADILEYGFRVPLSTTKYVPPNSLRELGTRKSVEDNPVQHQQGQQEKFSTFTRKLIIKLYEAAGQSEQIERAPEILQIDNLKKVVADANLLKVHEIEKKWKAICRVAINLRQQTNLGQCRFVWVICVIFWVKMQLVFLIPNIHHHDNHMLASE